MKKLITLITGLSMILLFQCKQTSPPSASTTKGISQDSLIALGKYIVHTGGCDDCHSPKKMGPQGPEIIEELRFSGYPSARPLKPIDSKNLEQGWALLNEDLTTAVGPWGQSFAANITSDVTGIGEWSEENFITVMRKGKYKGIESNRPILPPMPWFNIGQKTDFDLKAMFAYLKSTKPVSKLVPAPIPLDSISTASPINRKTIK